MDVARVEKSLWNKMEIKARGQAVRPAMLMCAKPRSSSAFCGGEEAWPMQAGTARTVVQSEAELQNLDMAQQGNEEWCHSPLAYAQHILLLCPQSMTTPQSDHTP